MRYIHRTMLSYLTAIGIVAVGVSMAYSLYAYSLNTHIPAINEIPRIDDYLLETESSNRLNKSGLYINIPVIYRSAKISKPVIYESD